MDILKGSTDKSVYVRIINATTGIPDQTIVYNTSGLVIWYRREGGTVQNLTLASLSALSDAHTDGGFLHVDDGLYRVDLPDAAYATGASHVLVGGACTGMIVIPTLVQLVNYNPEDGVRMGLTALPNAEANGAGGLPVSTAGGLNLDTKLANTDLITSARMGALTDWLDGGRLDLIIDGLVTSVGGMATADELADSVRAEMDASSTQLAAIRAKTDIIPFPFAKGVALNNFTILMKNSSDHATGLAGLTITGYIRQNNGTFSALTGTFTEIGNGLYNLSTITASEMNADIITLRFTATGADDTIMVIKTS